jgi:APA family basic amino acid/polyamine antiporter
MRLPGLQAKSYQMWDASARGTQHFVERLPRIGLDSGSGIAHHARVLGETATEIQQAERADEKLVRGIGVPALTANIINSTIGAGIFVVPAAVAKGLGPAAPLAFICCAIAMVLFVTCFAIAGSRVSLTGGLYAYVEVAFGRYVGFLAGVLYGITAISAVAGVGNVLVDSLGGLLPLLQNQIFRIGLMFTIYLVLVIINVRGVRTGAGAVTVVTTTKLVPILLFLCVGLFFINRANLSWSIWPTSQELGNSVLLLLFAFVGIEVALIPSGEVRNPARTVPRAAYLALVVTTIIYLLIQLVAQGTLGPDLASHEKTPLAEAAATFLGNTGRTILIVGAAISAFGFVASDILSSPRMLFAIGRDGVLPTWFARVHPRYRTPHVAIISYAAVAFVLSVCSSFEQLAVLSNVAVLLMYLLCCAGVWPLLRRKTESTEPILNFPGMQLVPALAIAAILGLFWSTQPWDKFRNIGAILVGFSILYFFRAWLRRKS